MIPRPGAVSTWRHHFQRQTIEWALRRADRMGRDLRIARRRRQIVVAEQDLNDPDVGSVLQEMGREAMAQRMSRVWSTRPLLPRTGKRRAGRSDRSDDPRRGREKDRAVAGPAANIRVECRAIAGTAS